jgi:hypothetical protein
MNTDPKHCQLVNITCWSCEADTSSQSVLLSRWRSASALRPVSSSLAASCARSASTWPSLAFRFTISTFIYSTHNSIPIVENGVVNPNPHGSALIYLPEIRINKYPVLWIADRIQNQDFGSMRIRIQFRIRIKGFSDQICKMLLLKKKKFIKKRLPSWRPRDKEIGSSSYRRNLQSST